MPRMARQKTDDAIFHVMSRSIKEVGLFKDDQDRNKYMSIVKKYQTLYKFKIYGYCLMDNHAHFIIDANGSDISSVMKSINISYAIYFNKRHDRYGHLFQDRFKSKMVKDERYLLVLSAYIHNNPVCIEKYAKCPEEYEYSSLSVYLGLRKDPFKLLDESFIMSFFGRNMKIARENYLKFVYKCDNKKFKEEIEFKDEETEYRSERKILVRNLEPGRIVEFIASKMDVPQRLLNTKGSKKIVEAKALLVMIMRSLCSFRCKDVCKVLGNITQARVSTLSSVAIELVQNNKKYCNIIDEFVNLYAC